LNLPRISLLGDSVKSFFFPLMLCALLASNTQAVTWVKAADSKISTIFVDTDGINITGNIVSAWYRRDYKKPMNTEKNRLYRSSKVLNYFNCTEHEIAVAQWIKYENSGGLGKIISNEKVISLTYGDVAAGETGKAVFDFVCNYAKRHKL
jgi:hypothetical protein